MNKEERKNILLTLPIETLVDLIIAGDEIEQRAFKTIEYIKNNDFHCKNQYEQEKYDEELLKILKGEDNE